MRWRGLRSRRAAAAGRLGAADAAGVGDQADAEIRVADADLDRTIKAEQAKLDLAEQRRSTHELAREQALRRKRREARLVRVTRKRRRALKRRGRVNARVALRGRFERALAGRLIVVLVAMAAATAWYGQFRFLRDGMALAYPFPAAGATALELFGLGMFGIARVAAEFRDRALRVRFFAWGVVGFSAYSNWVHNGVALAALSIAGPLAWEIHEWSRLRVTLHREGKLAVRPVRPRFPIDQALLFPVWTFTAYRVAVRDRIEDVNAALAVAARERADRRLLDRSARRSWARIVRQSIAQHRQTTVDEARREIADAHQIRRQIDRVQIDLQRQIDALTSVIDGRADRRPERSGASPDPLYAARSARPRDRSRWLRRVRTRIGSVPARSGELPGNRREFVIGRGEGADPTAPVPSTVDRPSAEQMMGRPPSWDPDRSAPAIDRDPALPIGHAPRIGGPTGPLAPPTVPGSGEIDRLPNQGTSTSDGSIGRSTTAKKERRSLDELRKLTRELIAMQGWTSTQITAEALRINLKCGPNRARILRDEFRPAAAEATGTDNTARRDVA